MFFDLDLLTQSRFSPLVVGEGELDHDLVCTNLSFLFQQSRNWNEFALLPSTKAGMDRDGVKKKKKKKKLLSRYVGECEPRSSPPRLFYFIFFTM